MSMKEFPLDIYGKSAFFNHPFYKKGETSYFAQIYGSNYSPDFVVAKRLNLKFISEIVSGAYVNSTNNISNIDNINIEKLELKLDKRLISDDGSIQYTKPDKDDLSKCIDMLIKR